MRSHLVLLALAQAALGLQNLTSSGCVDASGFQSCQNAANAKIQACFSRATGSAEAQQGCACEDYILNYNCYASHCWNQVWGCEYQQYIVAYLMNCPTAKLPVPYFPIPDDVKTGCSCNIGKIYNVFTDAITQGASCEKAQEGGTDALLGAEKMEACQCCELSGAMSR